MGSVRLDGAAAPSMIESPPSILHARQREPSLHHCVGNVGASSSRALRFGLGGGPSAFPYVMGGPG
eukprot:1108698-Pyramimonas_sp.AAC.1